MKTVAVTNQANFYYYFRCVVCSLSVLGSEILTVSSQTLVVHGFLDEETEKKEKMLNTVVLHDL